MFFRVCRLSLLFHFHSLCLFTFGKNINKLKISESFAIIKYLFVFLIIIRMFSFFNNNNNNILLKIKNRKNNEKKGILKKLFFIQTSSFKTEFSSLSCDH